MRFYIQKLEKTQNGSILRMIKHNGKSDVMDNPFLDLKKSFDELPQLLDSSISFYGLLATLLEFYQSSQDLLHHSIKTYNNHLTRIDAAMLDSDGKLRCPSIPQQDIENLNMLEHLHKEMQHAEMLTENIQKTLTELIKCNENMLDTYSRLLKDERIRWEMDEVVTDNILQNPTGLFSCNEDMLEIFSS